SDLRSAAGLEPALSRHRQRRRHRLRQAARGRRGDDGGESRPPSRAVGVGARAAHRRRPRPGAALSGARAAQRGALSLARGAQLRGTRPPGDSGPHLPHPPPGAHRARLRLLSLTERLVAASKRDAILDGDPTWYKDAIIYELTPKGLSDINADGIGDFRGLTERLDYLRDLGITALWLLPFYPSPLRDDGYDIADYAAVHHTYGTLRDFEGLLRAAHRRRVRAIT